MPPRNPASGYNPQTGKRSPYTGPLPGQPPYKPTLGNNQAGRRPTPPAPGFGAGMQAVGAIIASVGKVAASFANLGTQVSRFAGNLTRLGTTILKVSAGVLTGAAFGTIKATSQLKNTLTETVGAFQPAAVRRFELAVHDLYAVFGLMLQPVLVQVTNAIRTLSDWILTFYTMNRRLIDSILKIVGDFASWAIASLTLYDILGFVATILLTIIGVIAGVITIVVALIGSIMALTISVLTLTAAIIGLIMAIFTATAPLIALLVGFSALAVIIGLIPRSMEDLNRVLQRTGDLLQRIAGRATDAALRMAGIDGGRLMERLQGLKGEILRIVGGFRLPGADLLNSQGQGTRSAQEISDAASVGVNARTSMLGGTGRDPQTRAADTLQGIDRTVNQLRDAFTAFIGSIRI